METLGPPANSDVRISPPVRSRIVGTAALYFICVFIVGLVLGPIRVVWVEPALGRTLAVLCEAPFLLGAIGLAARCTPRWTNMQSGGLAYLAVGVLALLFQQVADLAVGFGLRGMTLSEQLALFATPPGYIYAVTLIAFALAPWVAWVRRGTQRLVARDQS